MSDKATRKKQPTVTRQQLLDVTASIILEEGLGAVTLDKVAAAAGVSKGGLLHHFRTKASLVESLLTDLCVRFEKDIERVEAKDALETGRHTRAVLRVMADLKSSTDSQLWSTLAFEVRHNEKLSEQYQKFLHETLAKDGQRTDEQIALSIVLLAADGLAMADSVGVFDKTPALRSKIIKQLEAITKDPKRFLGS